MKSSNITHRIVAATLLATLAIGTVAPAALAGNRGRGHGHGHKHKVVRYKGHRHRPVVVREVRVVERHDHSDWGPALAGFIGGVAIGAILSDRAEAQPAYHASYVYEDPYCHQRYSSLDAYHAHTRSRGCDHWAVARVIDTRSGACTQTLAWQNGGWYEADADWNYWRD